MFGLFNFVSSISLLLASLIAGYLWQIVGPSTTFLAAAAVNFAGLMRRVRCRTLTPAMRLTSA